MNGKPMQALSRSDPGDRSVARRWQRGSNLCCSRIDCGVRGEKSKSPGPPGRDRGGFKPSLRGEVLVKTQVHYILKHGSTRRQVGGIQE